MWRAAPRAATSTSPTTPARTGTARPLKRASGHVPGTGGARLDGRARRGPAAGGVLPRRLHPAGRDRPHRLLEQEGGLRPAVQGVRRDGDDHRGRPQAPRRTGRHDQRPAHLGLGADPPSPCPHDRPRRGSVAGRRPLGSLSPRVLPACAGAVAPVSPPVPPGAARAASRRRAGLLRRPGRVRRRRRLRRLAGPVPQVRMGGL